MISQLNHWADLDIKKEARKRNRGVQSHKTAKRRRTAVKENRVNDDDDETDDNGGKMGDDADGNDEEEEDENEIIDQGNEENTCVIAEVGINSDEDKEDDIQFVPLARTVTRVGRLAGSWFNLNN